MIEETTRQTGSSSIQISEEDLQESLKDFLESEDEKEKSSIWNIQTLSGLAFVFIALAFVGQSIGTELLGSAGLPFLNTLIKITPYLSGAMMAVISLGFLKQSTRKEKKEVKYRNQKTYDKLDEFLYANTQASGASGSKAESSGKSSINRRLQSSGGLTKSRSDKKIFGVCGGLSKYLGMSSTLLRVGFLIAFFLSSGSFFLLYIALAFVMPKESIEDMDDFN